MKIKVLGTGCSKCNELMSLTAKAVNELGLDVEIEKVSDVNEIVAYGIMTIPALLINGKVVVRGNVPKLNDLKEIIKKDGK